MRIVSDSNILSIETFLKESAELRLLPGREICREHLLDADVLLVRSITRVDENLLHGTPVRFVGTATSGTDHIDLDYLRSADIRFADARGSNANAVVDYCFAALAFAVLHRNLKLDHCTIGLVGAGHVGGLFAQKLDMLGIRYQVFDPLLENLLRINIQSYEGQHKEAGSDRARLQQFIPALSSFCSFKEILRSDVLSLHVPLTRNGAHPTFMLLGEHELSELKSNVTLINTCRGLVIHEASLAKKLRAADEMTCIMDVWANEPHVDADLVPLVDIATPHIAGYSQDAKLAATAMLCAELADFAGFAQNAVLAHDTAPALHKAKLPNADDSGWRSLLELFPLNRFTDEFKLAVSQGKSALEFDAMRKRLLDRREFKHTQILKPAFNSVQQDFLKVIGLQFGQRI